MAKRLSDICSQAVMGDDVMVYGLNHDSRKVCPGDLYLAIKGSANDGHQFIPEALANGAAAIAVQSSDYVTDQSSFIVDENLPAKQGEMASAFYDNPSAKLAITAITGTNGKTSVCQLAGDLLTALSGVPCCKIGTLGIEIAGVVEPSPNTTPSALLLQKTCAKQQQTGSKFVVLEASSHALVQGRLNGLTVSTAVFTNLSHDHLDYHGNSEQYFAAKSLLFKVPTLKQVVLPLDEPEARPLLALLADNVAVLSYSEKDPKATLYLQNTQQKDAATQLQFAFQGQSYKVQTALLGDFNKANLAQAILVALAEGFSPDEVFHQAGMLKAIDGRMQRVDNSQGVIAVVDYAHTPDALEKALITLRPYAQGKLICVFGCGGDRDKTKRSLMAEVAQRQADAVIVTSDNPRSEPLECIQADICQGFSAPCYQQIDDRQKAIEQAVAMAQPGDVVLVAGKGHEKTQQFADKTIAFDDVQVLQQALQGGRA